MPGRVRNPSRGGVSVTLLLFFAFTGAEAVLTPSGEIRDPARTLPRAIFGATACFVLIYVALQIVSQGILGQDLAYRRGWELLVRYGFESRQYVRAWTAPRKSQSGEVARAASAGRVRPTLGAQVHRPGDARGPQRHEDVHGAHQPRSPRRFDPNESAAHPDSPGRGPGRGKGNASYTARRPHAGRRGNHDEHSGEPLSGHRKSPVGRPPRKAGRENGRLKAGGNEND